MFEAAGPSRRLKDWTHAVTTTVEESTSDPLLHEAKHAVVIVGGGPTGMMLAAARPASGRVPAPGSAIGRSADRVVRSGGRL